MMKIMIDVLINPDRFFREKSKKEVSLKIPFLIVLIMAIIAAALSILILTEMMGALPKELAPFVSVGAVIGAIGGLIGAFAMWVIYTGIFHTISIAFKGEGRFRRVFEFVGYGFAPSIISSIIGLVVMIYALPTIDFSLGNPELMKQTLLDNQHLQMSRIINILFLLWSANIWIFGIKYARNLSTRDAAITVSIPVGSYLLYTLYTMHII
jgi:hypothetical protein